MAAAPNQETDTDGIEGREKKGSRKPRSSSGDDTMDNGTSRTAADRTVRGSSRSRSPSTGNRRTVTRNNSHSKKEHLKERTSSTRSKLQERSESGDMDKKNAERSSKDRPKLGSTPSSRKMSYLTTRTSASEKKGSKGRKENVLGSLNAFLEEKNEAATRNTRGRDAQSVISSGSRRRRSQPPSSASVVGGAAMSRAELLLQRRTRSSSAGPLERPRRSSSAGPLERSMRERERIRANSSNKDKDKEPRNRDHGRGGDSNRTRDPKRESLRKESSNCGYRSKDLNREPSSRGHRTGDLNRESSSRGHRTGELTKEPSTPRGQRSRDQSREPSTRGHRTRIRSKSVSAGPISRPRDERDTHRPASFDLGNSSNTLTLANGAEIPPGFPVAAVNRSNSAGNLQELDGLEGRTPVLESTAHLRERRASLGSAVLHDSAGALDTDKVRRKRRPSFGNPPSPGNSASGVSQNPTELRRGVRPSTMERRSNETSESPTRRRSMSIDAATMNTESTLTTEPDQNPPRNKIPEGRLQAVGKLLRRTLSSGSVNQISTPIPEKFLAHPNKSPDKQDDSPAFDLEGNLSKVNDKKSSAKSSKKGSGQSIASALASSIKNTLRSKKKGQKPSSPTANERDEEDATEAVTSSIEEKEPDQELTISDLQKGGQPATENNNYDRSTDSLNPDLLNEPSASKSVSRVNEMFDKPACASPFKESSHDQQTSRSSSESPEGRQGSFLLEQDDNRVTWVELPLHDPKQLLLKSADFDGNNETCTTHEMDTLSTYVSKMNDKDPSEAEKSESESQPTQSKEGKQRPNPSLEAAFSKEEAKRKTKGPLDERTVATCTSEATTKISNVDPSMVNAPASKNALKDESGGAEKMNASLRMDQLELPEPSEQGSSGSLSRSSRRSKDSESTSSVRSIEKRKSRRPAKSLVEASEGSKPSDRRRREGPPESKPQRRRSERKDHRHPSSGTGKENPHRNEKMRGSEQESKEKAGQGLKAGSGDTDESKEESRSPGKTKPLLQRMASGKSEAGGPTRRKSYLPRNVNKNEKRESFQQRRAINSSLDTFLKKMEEAEPVVKDDNRSVYSSMQDKDRKKRIRDRMKKNGETLHRRRGNREEPTSALERALKKGAATDDGNLSGDDDNMSVTSAPLLRGSMMKSSGARTLEDLQRPGDDSQRPIVSIKKTNFSSKLNKLQVAF